MAKGDTYDPARVEADAQAYWEEKGLYRAPAAPERPKFYILDMFPYPSGSGLHVGHVKSYTATDIYARTKRMRGYDVLHPMGWDAFGLPAENYAVKTKIHPRETTEKAIQNFRRQIKRLGLSYDWSREVGTHDPSYYRWTQWFFLLLYKNGLAYKARASVNWCGSCQTVLANEQVVNGSCERCGSKVVQKDLDQWFFKITEFADELVGDLDKIDWPESTKRNQRNWIGRSEGAELSFPLEGAEGEVHVFTTRPDTLFGATYLVLAPDHPLVERIKGGAENVGEIEAYVRATRERTEAERISEGKEKTGVEIKGVRAKNPGSGESIPLFIADYVLAHYGTGAIMAVPAHDQRDWEFAKKFGLPVRQVICDRYPQPVCPVLEEAYEGPGYLVGSGKFDGMEHEKAKKAVTESAGGTMKTVTKLRDWLVSRQRYWGAPIPIVYDPEGNPHPVPEEHLPWLLPSDAEFLPTGVSPLSRSRELRERTERIFGKGWRPEADTMDTFVCSSWYYFRFADPANKEAFASREALRAWLPVDLYVGGAEHTVLHLMYARFFTKVLRRLGLIEFDEPFLKLRHQGMVLAEDGRKMSKSLGNVINPDDVVEAHGADTLRIYEMFMGPLADSNSWNTRNIMGVKRFLDRVWRLQDKVRGEDDPDLEPVLHRSIAKVGDDVEGLSYNTAVSQLMILANDMERRSAVGGNAWKTFLFLLAPFAPHLAEELWKRAGGEGSVHEQSWPSHDPSKTVSSRVRLVFQINGKVRGAADAPAGLSEEEARNLALNNESVQRWIGGRDVKRVVVVRDKLVNIVA